MGSGNTINNIHTCNFCAQIVYVHIILLIGLIENDDAAVGQKSTFIKYSSPIINNFCFVIVIISLPSSYHHYHIAAYLGLYCCVMLSWMRGLSWVAFISLVTATNHHCSEITQPYYFCGDDDDDINKRNFKRFTASFVK